MNKNSVFRHQHSGILSLAAVEAPRVVTSDWIDEQLAETYQRNGLRPGLLAGLAGIEEADAILIIGSNPRWEAAVLNARIRKAWTLGASVSLVGAGCDLTYDYTHVGHDRSALITLVDEARKAGANGKPTVVIVGQGALNEADGEAVLSQVMALTEAMGAKLLVLHTAAARVGALDVGAVTEGGLKAAIDGAEVIYSLGADEVEIAAGLDGFGDQQVGDRGVPHGSRQNPHSAPQILQVRFPHHVCTKPTQYWSKSTDR